MVYEGPRRDPGQVFTWDWPEMFVQIAFAAELVLDHGWPGEGVILEFGALDVAAGDPSNASKRPELVAEAKLTDSGRRGLEAMMRVFTELSGGAPADVAKDVYDNAVPKYRLLQALQPLIFVEVAPEVRRAHRIRVCDDVRLAFELLPLVPNRRELS
jgi:hypothetical protein